MRIAVIVGMVLVALGIVAFMFFGSGGSGNTVKILDDTNVPLTGQTTLQLPSDSENVKEFTLTAADFAFTPEVITVNQGDTVILHITSIDVAHGIIIPDFNVNQQLPVGEEVTIEFVANKKGTFSFRCNVFCGSEHSEMTGSLVVN